MKVYIITYTKFLKYDYEKRYIVCVGKVCFNQMKKAILKEGQTRIDHCYKAREIYEKNI